MKDALARFFSTVKAKKDEVPIGGVLFVNDPSVPFSVTGGEPMAMLPVAEKYVELANLKTQRYERIFDARTNLLHEYDGVSYTSRPYYGEDAFLRPMTLCFSPPNGRLYYVDDGVRMYRINIGDDPYTAPINYDNRVNGIATELTEGPTPRRRHTLSVYENELYLLGGQHSTGGNLEFFKFDGSVWSKLPPFPDTIVDHSAVVTDGYLWVYGGTRTQSGTPLAEFRRYNFQNAQWESLPNGPVATMFHASAVDAQGRIYIHGGSASYNDPTNPNPSFYRYDVAAGTWEVLPDPIPLLKEHTMTRIGNKLYVFGGDIQNTYQDKLWVFNTDTDEWSEVVTVNSVPQKNRHAAGAFNGRLYVFGGNGGNNTSGDDDRYNDLWEFNPADLRWREVLLKQPTGAPPTIPIRQVPAYAMMDGVFYFHGGNAIVNGVAEGYSSDFWKIE